LTPRKNFAAWFDQKLDEILVVGGRNEEKASISQCERFNLIKRTSRAVQTMLEERFHLGLVLGITNLGQSRVFAIGGSGVNGQQLKSIESIDISNGVNANWEK